ncbi:type II toxin-antitoxin system RelE/ParE family toxin [Nitrospirillum iridis]|uniref:Plasmid stabilization system protein ParE n=1 Tax=Nitrospirillum iridis TaxID=765888 RepID=A0A7X0ATC4_9PROT|nr:type II toxin-antitoxin system RelE/ParE family toxin [Nitrospirillum iridis]MBB6249739.1 plasmid stabilization system protein ParE [Nitrospirillum iridis]
MRVILSPQARAEYIEAIEWYRHQAPGLDKRLRAAFTVARTRIAANPLQFPSVIGGTRRALLQDFPYLVIYRVTGGAVQVIAFFHTSRNPRQWQRRI